MVDYPDDDSLRKTPPTPEEVAEYEQAVQHLIRYRAPFDHHMKFLREVIEEKADNNAQRPPDP